MKSNTPQMIIAHENPEDNTLYLIPAIPFDLLEVTTSGKSLPEYYKKLDFLTREYFMEYCYRNKKNFTYIIYFGAGIIICKNILKDSHPGFTTTWKTFWKNSIHISISLQKQQFYEKG